MRPLLDRAPRGDGHPVLVLPGFMADDRSTAALRGYLQRLGYAVHGWNLGRNVGPTPHLTRGLRHRVDELRRGAPEQAMSIVGWSLGGLYAREIARRVPSQVRQVITLGSPFSPAPGEESHPTAAIRLLTGRHVRDRVDEGPLPVPSTAIYTRTDGIVPWRASRAEAGPQAESIEVLSSHCGLGHHPAVLWAVADRLAQPEGQWAPFHPSGMWMPLFPKRRAS
ncbi:MAG: hypothetical protein JWM05_460 [Acidimicrobiales bacterium]|nr:hypothetical protein [Acidimicrobiales bacterium]